MTRSDGPEQLVMETEESEQRGTQSETEHVPPESVKMEALTARI
jgi:hypothetical protein